MLKFEYNNACDLDPIYYQEGFVQRLYLDAEMVKAVYPVTEQGAVNNNGDFVQQFSRWDKRYTIELLCPEYVMDALFWMSVHDNVKLYDAEGDVTEITDIQIEYEWKECWTDCKVTFSVDELVKSTCCSNAGDEDVIDIDGPVEEVAMVWTRYQDVNTDNTPNVFIFDTVMSSGHFSYFSGFASWNEQLLEVPNTNQYGNSIATLRYTQPGIIMVKGVTDPTSYVFYSNPEYWSAIANGTRFTASGPLSIIDSSGSPVIGDKYIIIVVPNPIENTNIMWYSQIKLGTPDSYKAEIYHYQDQQFTPLNLNIPGNIVSMDNTWYEFDGSYWREVPYIYLNENTSGDTWHFQGIGIQNSFVQAYSTDDEFGAYTPIGSPITANEFNEVGYTVTFATCCINWIKFRFYNHSHEFTYSDVIYCAS